MTKLFIPPRIEMRQSLGASATPLVFAACLAMFVSDKAAAGELLALNQPHSEQALSEAPRIAAEAGPRFRGPSLFPSGRIGHCIDLTEPDVAAGQANKRGAHERAGITLHFTRKDGRVITERCEFIR